MSEVVAVRTATGIGPLRRVVAWAVGLGLAAGGLAIAATRDVAAIEAIRLLVALGMLAWVAMVDVQTLRAPNVIVLPTFVFSASAAFASGPEHGLLALAGGGLALSVLAGLAIVSRGTMGMGDVKVGAISGTLVGAAGVVPLLFATFLAAGAVAAVALVLRIRSRKDVIALTPFIALGTLVALGWQ